MSMRVSLWTTVLAAVCLSVLPMAAAADEPAPSAAPANEAAPPTPPSSDPAPAAAHAEAGAPAAQKAGDCCGSKPSGGADCGKHGCDKADCGKHGGDKADCGKHGGGKDCCGKDAAHKADCGKASGGGDCCDKEGGGAGADCKGHGDRSGAAAGCCGGSKAGRRCGQRQVKAPVCRNGEATFRPVARIELRAALVTGDDNQRVRGDLAERPGFAIPRARLGARGDLSSNLHYVLVTDLAAAQAGAQAGTGGALTDAFLSYDRYRFAKMWFGVATVPFSYSAILSSADAGLSERARAADAMAPFRQVGVTIGGDYDLAGLSWRAGVYNGFDRQSSFYQGAESPAGLRGNRFHGLSGALRLQVQPLGAVGDAVADLDGGPLRLSLGGGSYVNDSGSAFVMAMSGDLHVKMAGAHLLVEWIADEAKPVDQPTTGSTLPESIKRQAISAEVGYTYHRFGVAVRTELIDPNKGLDNSDDEMWLSAALTWHFLGNSARFQLQYDHRREMHGAVFDNDTLLAKIAARY